MSRKLLTLFFCGLIWGMATIPGFAQSPPEKTFEKFWARMDQIYPFFPMKGVDWKASYEVNRPRITAETTPNELAAIMAEMLEPLRDGHTSVRLKGERVEMTRAFSHFRTELKGRGKEFWPMVYATLEAQGFKKGPSLGALFQNTPIFVAFEREQIAYIRISRNFAKLSSMGMPWEAPALKGNFRKLIKRYQNYSSIIIDLRGNPGGSFGYEMAGHFASVKQVTHYKRVRKGPKHEDMSDYKPYYVKPAKPHFSGKALILTNDRTASSAEDFSISLRPMPQVTFVGDTTSGALSDLTSFKPGLGIQVYTSKQMYHGLQKEELEDLGVVPDVLVRNFREDLDQGEDPVLMKALEIVQDE